MNWLGGGREVVGEFSGIGEGIWWEGGVGPVYRGKKTRKKPSTFLFLT